MGLSRLGGVCTSKLWPTMAFALFMLLTRVGLAQPAQAYPVECTGSASDRAPRCIEPNISVQRYDSADHLISVSDNQGNSIQYTLDGAGNRVSEQVKDPSRALSRQLARAFNTLGKKQQVTGME
jgi:YD repeat-containing protein